MRSAEMTFGPVPSRRLGRSMGINNIPPKVCSYSCVYCQVGRTDTMLITRKAFYDPRAIYTETARKIKKVLKLGESIDFLTFVADGEPTLDSNLGRTIDLLRPLGVRIAVISNASLVWRENVRKDLAKADWVSLKVDTASIDTWRRINRPHRELDLSIIQKAMVRFAEEYGGDLVTETMLVRGVNDKPDHIQEVAGLLAKLRPAKAYLSIPTRPPAERWVSPPDENVLNMAYQVISRSGVDVECLFGYEGNAFSLTGNVEESLLNIIAVHPMQDEAVRKFLTKAGTDWTLIDKLVAQGRIVVADYEGKTFYLRRVEKKHTAHDYIR